MEDWNWQQILGSALLTVGGSVAIGWGLAQLSRLLSHEYSTAILIVLMLLVGTCLWLFGKKKGRKKRIS